MPLPLRPALLLLALFPALSARGDGPARPIKNVVLVTTDGLRWQEVFRGAEAALMNKPDGGVTDLETLRRDFWRDTPEERRAVLMPFLWGTVARQGQIYGNVDKGSTARVTNGKNFSYPGYNELLTGAPDPRIDSNDKTPNPNATVLEWLQGKPAYAGKVAAFGSWDVFPYILRREKSGLFVNAGWEPVGGGNLSDAQALVNSIMLQAPRVWDDCRDDGLTFPAAFEYLRSRSPRVLYISLGDTDEFAHAGRYDKYLRAARRVDDDLKALWNELQSRPEYRGTTTMIVTTDHGRGDPPRGWRDHGAKTKGSEFIWLAAIGPDTPALGERTNMPEITQSQVASTVAAALGEDYKAAAPTAAPAVPEVIRARP